MPSTRGFGFKNRSFGGFSTGKGVPGVDANFSDCGARLAVTMAKGPGLPAGGLNPFGFIKA